MSLTLTNEEYEGLPSLYANSGDWINAQLKFYTRFDFTSNLSARATYNAISGNYTITLAAGDTWENYGFAVGDAIVLTSTWVYFDGSGTYSQAQTWPRTITYLSGGVMHISAALIAVPSGGTPPVGEVGNGKEFPTDSITNRFTDLTVVKATAAEEIEFNFNLTPDGSTSLNSVIDGELQRFTSSAISSMGVASTIPLNQLVNKSGGYIADVMLTYDSIDGNGYRAYTITYKVLQWGLIQNGFAEPDYYNAGDNLAPIAKIQLFGQTGNPNTILEITSENVQADTGGFNENFNGGINNNILISTEWHDFLGNPISGMDYSNESTFETFITTSPSQSINNSTFRFGLVFRPSDGAIYQSLPDSLANNLLVNAPEVDFMHNPAPDPTVYAGFVNSDGVQLDVTDLEFFISGSTLRVRGKVIPNAAAITYFGAFPDGTRKTSIWVSIGNYLNDGTEFSERVNLLISNDDIIDAPTLGVQIPDVVGTIMFDHANRDAEGTDVRFESTITTEDDVRYEATLRLIDNIAYEGMRVKVNAFNSVSGDNFDLEEIEFSFAGVTEIAGQFQPNFDIPRGFNLPPTTDRNSVTLKREPTLDIAGKYGIKVCYGFLSMWEYWIEQLNVDNDFFDITEPHNGKNKNWQKFSNINDWNVRISLFTIVDGVEDFDYHVFKIRPYEDEDADTVVTYTRLSDGSNPISLVDDEIMEVESVITWNAGVYELLPDTWAEATIEDYESGNRWVISSVLPHGGVVANPLEPIPTSVGLDLVIAGSVATLKFRIDCNKINVNKVSLSYRIGSLENLDKIMTTSEQKITDTLDNKVQA